jgi:cis-3-alkyl-4-acyloxetan-2-one decarboxylase / olefin beta-lactone synthetase
VTTGAHTAVADTSWTPQPPTDDDWHRWDLDPTWSRLVDVVSHTGGTHRWHVLDTGVPEGADAASTPTVLCVHGNPTWGYAWATFLRKLHTRYRVIAVDQLGMGYSERVDRRRYVDRVRDLDDVIVALGLPGSAPLVLAAHDWGGAIAMGWVVQDPRQVAGMILCNTGIAVPAGRKAPAIIRLAAWAPILDFVCRGTPIFVEGTSRLSRGRLTKADREAFRAPYPTAPSRAAIADFVDDIPLSPGHPSEAAIAEVAGRLGSVRTPVLLAWGAKDPVFNDDFAADLADRFPNSTTHRFADANHLVMAEADVAGVADAWLEDLFDGRLASDSARKESDPGNIADGKIADPDSVWSAISAGRGDQREAFVDLATGESITFDELASRVEGVAVELGRRGLQPGDHVAMLTPPGVDLVAAVYGVWRAGGVTVIADRGLGLTALGRAVRSTRPSWVVGPKRALAAATALRWAPRATRLDVAELVGAIASVGDLPPPPSGDELAAVLFTSGATGPAKGVRYLHRQLVAQRDALAATYSITPNDRLVAAFAPFALYGPALGIPTALPDCDVTKPAELTASRLDEACARIGATLAFASPSALANVAATADGSALQGLRALRVVFSAGAPVPSETLRAVASLAPDATLHTPYGMTEVLPVADIELEEITRAELADPDGGVCVGRPVLGAQVRIVPLDFDPDELPDAVATGEVGEILVRAPWVSEGYLGLWATQRAARPGSGDWHRSGDVGHVDGDGRLWVEGRATHVIHGVDDTITPVPVERAVERALGIARSAAVGVGPAGRQQLVVVLEQPGADAGPADAQAAAQVRAVTGHAVASVLTVPALPVDIRHNAKIDRAAVAAWAEDVLAGRRVRQLA